MKDTGRARRRGLMLGRALLAAAVLLIAAAGNSSAASWTLQEAAETGGGTSGVLRDVSCASGTFCMSAGEVSGKRITREVIEEGGELIREEILLLKAPIAQTWNGTAWTAHDPAIPVGTTSIRFNGVACPSESFCMAVGTYVASTGKDTTIAEVWNGSSWSISSTPNPAESLSRLEAVSCASSTHCVAVGNYAPRVGNGHTLAEVWNGRAWSIQTTPTTGVALEAVSCPSEGSCVAVGYGEGGAGRTATLALAWNGVEWVVQRTPSLEVELNFLLGVSCTAATSCTAVGEGHAIGVPARPIAVRWNGREWLLQSVPTPTGSEGVGLSSVSCTAESACAAVGDYHESGGNTLTLAESWNGSEWGLLTPLNPRGAIQSVFDAISCSSTSVCSATGMSSLRGASATPLVERYA